MEKIVILFIKKIVSKIRFIVVGSPKLKQELLLRKALEEKGFNCKKLKISCNHDLGKNYVNGVEMGIKYPDSFYEKAKQIITDKKIYSFYFNGNMNPEGGRKEMLKPFEIYNDSLIISTDDGRIQSSKDKFNNSYFSYFSKSKFGLCPHQEDWPGSKKHLWTYRFIESCLVEAIPVIFDATPLAPEFINGFFVLKDSDFKNIKTPVYDILKANKNRVLAKKKFFLTDEECYQIKINC